jgi:transposase
MYDKTDLIILTEKVWQNTGKLFESKKRKRKHPLKEILRAVLYVVKTGCQWRMLPECFPKWELVYYYFSNWKREGLFEEILDTVRNLLRKGLGRESSPSVGIIDSQSVKSASYGGENRGVDGFKKINGRKRHIPRTLHAVQVITDTNGLLLSVIVHAANEYDGKMSFDVIKTLKYRFERMKKIFADGGYLGEELAKKLKKELGYDLEIALRCGKSTEFKPLPKRWVIERSFAWLNGFRRLSKEYLYYACLHWAQHTCAAQSARVLSTSTKN